MSIAGLRSAPYAILKPALGRTGCLRPGALHQQRRSIRRDNLANRTEARGHVATDGPHVLRRRIRLNHRDRWIGEDHLDEGPDHGSAKAGVQSILIGEELVDTPGTGVSFVFPPSVARVLDHVALDEANGLTSRPGDVAASGVRLAGDSEVFFPELLDRFGRAPPLRHVRAEKPLTEHRQVGLAQQPKLKIGSVQVHGLSVT